MAPGKIIFFFNFYFTYFTLFYFILLLLDLALADSAANMIDYSEMEMGKVIGEGGFAKVYKATYRGNKNIKNKK